MNDLKFAFRQLLKNAGFTVHSPQCRCPDLGQFPQSCCRESGRLQQSRYGGRTVAVLTLALGIGIFSQQFLELLNGETRVLDDLAHRESVDRIVARDHDDPHAVAHDRVLAFADDLEACFLQAARGGSIIDARQFGDRPSDGDDLARDLGSKSGGQLRARLQVFANGVPDILESFLAVGPLAATARQVIAPDRESFFGFNQRHRVIHRFRIISHGLVSRR